MTIVDCSWLYCGSIHVLGLLVAKSDLHPPLDGIENELPRFN